MTSQAIEAAIELNLSTVEAGAQGEHKIQRGYLPVTTYSCHYLMDEGFRKAIENFVGRESTQMIALIISEFRCQWHPKLILVSDELFVILLLQFICALESF